MSAGVPKGGVAPSSKRVMNLAHERFGCGDVGLGRALAYGNADAGAREIGAARQYLALFDQIVDRIAVDDITSAGLPSMN